MAEQCHSNFVVFEKKMLQLGFIFLRSNFQKSLSCVPLAKRSVAAAAIREAETSDKDTCLELKENFMKNAYIDP